MPRRLRRPGSWAVPAPVVALGVVLVVGVLLEAVHDLRVHPGSSPAGPFFDDWLHDLLILTSAGVCFAGAARHRHDRRAWRCAAFALLSLGLGEVLWDLLYTDVAADAIPYPNVVDVFDLLSYPLFLAALFLIVRRRVPSIELHRWLDGVVVVLVVATPMVALVLTPVLRAAPPDLPGQIVTLAYPFGDLVLIGTLLGALPMLSWRVDPSWFLLGVGLLCLTLGDAAYASSALDAVYHNGPLDFLWSAGSVAIALAAWVPAPGTRPPSELYGWRAIILPLGAQLLAVAAQVLGYFVDLPSSERLLTIAILVIAAAQIVISRPRPPEEPAPVPQSRPHEVADHRDRATP
jgi:hypothetical protein